jgi:Ser-tRNA(Ala) deacylase AlaX
MKHILECMLAGQEMLTARLEAKIEASSKKFEVFLDISQMDIHQARTEDIQEEIIAKMDSQQERMEACMNAW